MAASIAWSQQFYKETNKKVVNTVGFNLADVQMKSQINIFLTVSTFKILLKKHFGN